MEKRSKFAYLKQQRKYKGEDFYIIKEKKSRKSSDPMESVCDTHIDGA